MISFRVEEQLPEPALQNFAHGLEAGHSRNDFFRLVAGDKEVFSSLTRRHLAADYLKLS